MASTTDMKSSLIKSEKLFKILPKIANYTVVSEPKWNDLSLPVMTDDFVVLDKIHNTVHDHTLYKL